VEVVEAGCRRGIALIRSRFLAGHSARDPVFPFFARRTRFAFSQQSTTLSAAQEGVNVPLTGQ
jgi:hypothetical protein